MSAIRSIFATIVKKSDSTESLEDSENLPEPQILAQEIVDNLGVALSQFESIVEELESPII